MKDGYWKCKDGRVMLIEEMDDQHLNNSIRMIYRGRDRDGDPVSHRTASKIHLLEEELERRKLCKKGGVLVTEKVVVDKKKYDFIDVRFATSPGRIYTYKVRKGSKCFLGQQLIVNNDSGTSVVFVVGINVPGKTGSVEITEKVVKL